MAELDVCLIQNPSNAAAAATHVPEVPTVLVYFCTSEATATCDYSSSRRAAAVHPLNKLTNECLFYISVTFCAGESSHSLHFTPAVRPSGRGNENPCSCSAQRCQCQEALSVLFFFSFWGWEVGGAGGGQIGGGAPPPPHLQPLRTTSPHALFISVHGFVIDSFFYPMAAIFHMAYLDAAPPPR